MTRHPRHVIFAIVFLVAQGCAHRTGTPTWRLVSGANEVRNDIAAGQLRIFTYGLAAPQDERFAAALQDQMGVTVERIAGCAISGPYLERVESYNRVMRAEIERRFGPGSIGRLHELPRAHFATSRPATEPAAGE